MNNEQLAEHMGILVQSLRAEMNTRFDELERKMEQKMDAGFQRLLIKLERQAELLEVVPKLQVRFLVSRKSVGSRASRPMKNAPCEGT